MQLQMQIGMFVLCSIDSVLFTQPQSTVCHLDELHFECENATCGVFTSMNSA